MQVSYFAAVDISFVKIVRETPTVIDQLCTYGQRVCLPRVLIRQKEERIQRRLLLTILRMISSILDLARNMMR